MMFGQITRATTLMQLGRHAEAEAVLREALSQDMEDAFIWQFLAQVLLAQKKYRQAEDAARQAVKYEPEEDSSHFVLAKVLVETGDSGGALKACQESIRLAPEDAQNHALLSSIHWAASRYQDCVDAARQALHFDADNETAKFFLGLALSRLGKHAEADSAIDELLSDDPEDADNHVARGFQFIDRGDHESARRHFLEALRLQPMNEGARHGLAQAINLRNPVAAIILRTLLFTSRFGWKGIIVIIVALQLVMRSLRWASDIPFLSPVCIALLAAISLLMILSTAHEPLFALLLLMDREGRHTVRDRERIAVWWCLPLLVYAAWRFGYWLVNNPSQFPKWALLAVALTLPVWEVSQAVTRWARRWMAALAVSCVLLAFVPSIWFGTKAASNLVQQMAATINLTKEQSEEKLKPALDELQVTASRLHYLSLAILILCISADSIRERLDRRAPSDDD